MGGAFCCASLGIVPTVRHADYIGSWLEVLREDNRAIVRAASAASKAADFLLGFVSDRAQALPADPSSESTRRRDARTLASWLRARVRGGAAFRDGLEVERELLAARRGESDMATPSRKSSCRPRATFPSTSWCLSQSNVRRVKAGVSIEQLAESIAQRTLLQSLSVRAVLDADGQETGMFEVPAGGRRYRALELLVKQKRMAKTATCPLRGPRWRHRRGRFPRRE